MFAVAVDYHDIILCNISGNSFSNMGVYLSHSKYKGSNCTIYLLLICIALFLTCFISCSCAFAMLTGSAKLILPKWLLSAILTLPKYSTSASLFGALYVGYDVSPGFAGASCVCDSLRFHYHLIA